MSEYVKASKRNQSSALLRRKQKPPNFSLKRYLHFGRIKDSFAVLVVSVCMSMSVWRKKKKEEKRKHNKYPHTNTLAHSHNSAANAQEQDLWLEVHC
jgi:hypothetical protein